MTSIPETALRARQDYLEGKTVLAVRTNTGFSLARLYYWLDGGRQADGTTLLPRRKVAGKGGEDFGEEVRCFGMSRSRAVNYAMGLSQSAIF